MSQTSASVKLSGFTLQTTNFHDFAAKAALIPIIRGRGMSGLANAGKPRWLCHNNYEQPDALGTLRAFFRHCMSYFEQTTGQKLPPVEANEFIGASIANILDPTLTQCECLYYAIGPQDRVLILYRDDAGQLAGRSREEVLGAVWLVENQQGGAT